MRCALLLQTIGGSRTRYHDAALRLGINLIVRDLPSDDDDGALASIVGVAKAHGVTACLAADARAAVAAAVVGEALSLPGHPAGAAGISRNKLLTRERLRDSDLLVPWFFPTSLGADPSALASMVAFPCVVKPVGASSGRGVMRADDAPAFLAAFERVREHSRTAGSDALERETALVEGYVDGWEFALAGVMHHGTLHAFAIIDKPDPLEGPLFEDTLCVVPSLAPEAMQWDILDAIARAAAAIGLRHGPVHADCRVGDRGVYVLGVGAKPLDAPWAKTLRFVKDGDRAGSTIPYEDLVLRHALGESPNGWRREPEASGAMKHPTGGYIYARGASAEAVERELRARAVIESRHG